ARSCSAVTRGMISARARGSSASRHGTRMRAPAQFLGAPSPTPEAFRRARRRGTRVALHSGSLRAKENPVRRTRSKTHPAASQPRIDHVLESIETDAYGQKGKLADPTTCSGCGALYKKGRRTWQRAPQ